MDFNEINLPELLKEVRKGNDIKLSEIPDIDLYMDQVTTFIDNKLSHQKRDPDDKLLTKTMINNYTKSKILLPSKNKKYNRQHMVLLILIYYLKQILSINDINLLFSPILKGITSEKKPPDLLEELYNTFLDVKNDGFDVLEGILEEKQQLIEAKIQNFPEDSKDMAKMLLTVLMLVTQANTQKRMAEKIIDEYFKIKK